MAIDLGDADADLGTSLGETSALICVACDDAEVDAGTVPVEEAALAFGWAGLSVEEAALAFG